MPVLAQNQPFDSARPNVVIDNALAVGHHRFALTVVDDSGLESAADVLVVEVRRAIVDPTRPLEPPVLVDPVRPPVSPPPVIVRPVPVPPVVVRPTPAPIRAPRHGDAPSGDDEDEPPR